MCDGLNFRLVVPCGLVDGHDGPHLGVVSDGYARCRAAWDDNYGRSRRVGITHDTNIDESKRCTCPCHSTWRNDGLDCICCVVPQGGKP